MTAAYEIVERSDTRLHESLINILAHVSRRRSVKRQVTAFCTDHELIARDAVFVRDRPQRFADRAFASLKTIIRGAVDDVRAELDCAYAGVRVVRISGLVRMARVGGDGDRREHQILLLAKMAVRGAACESFVVA